VVVVRRLRFDVTVWRLGACRRSLWARSFTCLTWRCLQRRRRKENEEGSNNNTNNENNNSKDGSSSKGMRLISLAKGVGKMC